MNKTKLFFIATIILAATIIFNSCKKKKENPVPVPTGVPYAVGTPVGSPNSLSIDASGGTIISTDGRLEIIIPANALSAATNITIQPITNTIPQGAGLAYSLTPHGQQFSQPVTLRFHYDSADWEGGHFNFLEMATQKSDNIWYAFKNFTLDSVAHTVSITTPHFSSYGSFNRFQVSPRFATIAINETQSLTVNYLADGPPDTEAPDELASLAHPETYQNPTQVSWMVNTNSIGVPDDGIVSPETNSSTTTYTAPSNTVNMGSNPAIIKATVNPPGGRVGWLILPITVISNVYDFTIDYAGTQIDFVWFKASYTDHAAFTVTMTTDDHVASVTNPVNFEGVMSAVVSNDASCNIQTNGSGNLLQITSYLASPQANTLTIDVFSNRITPAFTQVCPSGSLPFPSYSNPRHYSWSGIILDGQIHSQTIIEPAGDLITITIIPQ